MAAIVSINDDPTLPTLTFRFWVLSTFFTITMASASQFFFFRLVSLTLSPMVTQILSYPFGQLMAKILPKHSFFNPGPFNRKEHALICIASSTATWAAYAIDILSGNGSCFYFLVQRIYYDQNIGPLASLLLLWTTQCLGYGLAGFLRKYLVTPRKMIWPLVLPMVCLTH